MIVLALSLLAAHPFGSRLPALAQDKGLEFYERKVRPVLSETCYECHSARSKKLKGSLYLDSREGLLKGGDTGPAVVPGDPGKSLLLRAVHWEDEDLRMPPKRKLSDAQIADLDAWVKMGAPAPAGPAVRRQIGMSIEEGRRFWAYRNPVKAAAPEVPGRTEIDRFLNERIQASGLAPAPEADRPTLIRRLTYDLWGLPATPEDVDAFVKDPAPDAYEALIDRLLASPRFGERWGRHWLDVARYAESLTLRGFIMKEAWRYRDYVIEAFNEDRPYDRFVREQIAGDLLEAKTLEERRRGRVATSFLLLGNTNLEEQDKRQLEMDVVDEQIDVLTRAFLAQTVACARCHDHKFDPIPTRDYYAIAGILKSARVLEHANVSKWIEDPLPVEPEREAELRKHEAALAALQDRLKAEKAKAGQSARQAAEVAKGVLAVDDVAGIVVDDAQAEKVGVWKDSTHSGVYIGAGYTHDQNDRKGESSLTFQAELRAGRYEVRFAYSPGAGRASNVPVTILSADGEKVIPVNMKETPPIDGRFVSLGQHRFETNQGYVLVSNEGTDGHVTADAVAFVATEKLAAAKAKAPKTPESASIKALEAEIKRLQETGPKRELSMALREEKKPVDLKIHIRGSVHTLGELAPRGVLQVALDGPAPAMPSGQSGRRELADWIASPEHPLTARVMANRVWHWIFGQGLVRTTDNFGTTGETPSHPELLDHLARRFVEDGWSVKALVRRIVATDAYRRSSSAPASDVDPDNRLLARMTRRRMDAESLRDALLAVAGRLDLEGGGPTFKADLSSDYAYRHSEPVRSVYVPVFRNALPDIFAAFDFADPSLPTGRRDVSTVAPQALFMLNNPFVHEQARAAAARLLKEKHADDRSRAVRAWRLALGRPPSAVEQDLALRHAAGAPSPEKAWTDVVHALFASVDFRYVE